MGDSLCFVVGIPMLDFSLLFPFSYTTKSLPSVHRGEATEENSTTPTWERPSTIP